VDGESLSRPGKEEAFSWKRMTREAWWGSRHDTFLEHGRNGCLIHVLG
jgi:hypothetical protein